MYDKFTKFGQDSKPLSHELNPSTPKNCRIILTTQSKQAQIFILDKNLQNVQDTQQKVATGNTRRNKREMKLCSQDLYS